METQRFIFSNNKEDLTDSQITKYIRVDEGNKLMKQGNQIKKPVIFQMKVYRRVTQHNKKYLDGEEQSQVLYGDRDFWQECRRQKKSQLVDSR